MRDWKEEYGIPPRTCLPTLRDWTEWTPPSTCFEPISLTSALSIAGTAASAGGSLIGGMGQSKQYQAQADEARYRAQVAENNRIVAEQNARYAVQAGRTNAFAQDLQTRAALGTATAAQGASGLDVGQGSPVEVRSSIQQLGRLKTLEEIQKADLEAYGYRQKASDFGAEAGLQQYKASSAERAKSTVPLTTLATVGAGVADKWRKWQDGGSGSSSKDPWSFTGSW
jgi:hypothetical protein